MGFYASSSLIASITLVALGLFMFINGRSRLEIRVWGYICFGVVFWQVGSFGFSTAKSKEIAFYWWQFAHIGAIIVPPIFFHFTCIYLEIRKKWLQISAYIFSVIFIAINFCWGRHFIGDLRLTPDNFYWVDWFYYRNPLFIIYYILAYGLLLGYAYILLLKAFRYSRGIRRKQFQYLIIGTIVAWSGPMGIIISYFRIDLYAYTNILMGLFPLIMGYAIIRYHLMDIDVIVKKTLVFAGLSAFLLGVIVLVSFLLQYLVIGNSTIGTILSCLIIVLLFRPIENFLVSATDKYLFQKKYDYRQVMQSFIDDIATILDLDKIVTGTIKLLDETLHPQVSDILLLNVDKDKFISHGVSDEITVLSNSNGLRIINYLRSAKNILSIENNIDKKIDEELKSEMRKLHVILAVPILIRDELIGIMLLGKKRSDEYYTADDLRILMDLARTEAIAIKNAQLTKEIADKSERRGVENTTIGASHQIKNTLGIIKAPLQALHALITRSDINNITPEKSKIILDTAKTKLEDVFDEIEHGRKTINAILYGEDKDDVVKEIDIHSLADRAIDRSIHAKSKDFIEANIVEPVIKNDIPHNFPKIVGGGKLVEESLVNIVNNSFDAIMDKYTRLKPDNSYRGMIEITAEDNGNRIRINIKDNGIGMDDETKGKIFGGLFTTKRASDRGFGAGLFSLKGWLEKCGGGVTFSTEYGKGSIFTMELPKVQEGVSGIKNNNS